MASKFLTPSRHGGHPNVLAAGGARKSRWGVLAADSDSDSDRSLSPPPAPRKPFRDAQGAGHGVRAAFLEPLPSPPRSPPALRDAQGAGHGMPASDLLRAFCQTDPVFLAMARGDLMWGDIEYESAAAPAPAAAAEQPRRRTIRFADEVTESAREARALEATWNAAESALWQQPFAEKLESNFGDHFDLTGLDDAEYESFMRYIYANGFYVEEAGRNACYAVPSTEEPRQWLRDTHGVGHGTGRFAGLAAEHHHAGGCCGPAPRRAAMAAPGTDVGRRRGAPVPRFCRAAGACQEEGCRYVHGDTIQRVNLPCSFGDACGASDPTGVKRSQCLRMHPGEEWSADLVIRRV